MSDFAFKGGNIRGVPSISVLSSDPFRKPSKTQGKKPFDGQREQVPQPVVPFLCRVVWLGGPPYYRQKTRVP